MLPHLRVVMWLLILIVLSEVVCGQSSVVSSCSDDASCNNNSCHDDEASTASSCNSDPYCATRICDQLQQSHCCEVAWSSECAILAQQVCIPKVVHK